MKNKLIIVAALVTLVMISFSFTFSGKQVKPKPTQEVTNQNEPIGGFVSESKF